VESPLTFACATEPLSDPILHDIGLGSDIPFYTVDTPYLWGRQTHDRRMIFGAGLIYRAPEELERLDLDAAEPAAVLARLEARVLRLHPALRDVQITHRWGGPIGIPQGGMPLIGRLPQAPAILVAGLLLAVSALRGGDTCGAALLCRDDRRLADCRGCAYRGDGNWHSHHGHRLRRDLHAFVRRIPFLDRCHFRLDWLQVGELGL